MIFKNEPFTDFSKDAEAREMEAALALVKSQLGRTYSLMIDGKEVKARKTFRSINPSHASHVIGLVQDADRALADRALEAATRTFESWRFVSQEDRAGYLRKMAAILRRRKKEFAAWMILEVGKSWAEADADVAEAIDFLEYYAELSLIEAPVPTTVIGEKNRFLYLPLGPVIVIPPWNFPLAILVGMTAAAVVTGNTVVLKPSSQSPVIAAKFMELVKEAELPPGVVNFLTGGGGKIGDFLVADPRTRMIAFTGSKTVGLHINALAAQASPGQRWIKRVIAEMGGKNAIVVDESASLEDAVQGVLSSAFGYQGQKCSACSRAYIHQSIYDAFVERFVKLVKQIRVGPPENRANYMGPVISASARDGILKYIACGKKHGRLLTPPSPLAGDHGAHTSSYSAPSPASLRESGSEGFYVPPTVFDRMTKSCKVLNEEIFGPVVVLTKIRNFEEGIREANASDYGLTGAVYSADPAHAKLAGERFFCGNLYINRKCTGALVGGHPFGGFNMSGTDSKAGGPDYLSLFRQGQSISERL